MIIAFTLQILFRPLLAPLLVQLIGGHENDLDDDEDENEETHAGAVGGDH